MTELIQYQPPASTEWDQLRQTAEMVAGTDFAPKQIRNSEPAIMATLLTGRELGIGPMQALREVYIVNGTPTLKATLMVARVRAAGHRFRTLENTDESSTVQITRRGETEPEPAVTFTLADAKRAKLAGKDVWQQYPRSMTWSRAASAACRRDAPEALGGVIYTPEEIASIDEGPVSTTAAWGEPEQDTGPQGTPVRGRQGGTAVPVQTPDTPPPGVSGGPDPDQVPPNPGSGPGANLDEFKAALAKIGMPSEDAVARLRRGGWTLPARWWDEFAGPTAIPNWSPLDLAEAIQWLETGGQDPPAQPKAEESAA